MLWHNPKASFYTLVRTLMTSLFQQSGLGRFISFLTLAVLILLTPSFALAQDEIEEPTHITTKEDGQEYWYYWSGLSWAPGGYYGSPQEACQAALYYYESWRPGSDFSLEKVELNDPEVDSNDVMVQLSATCFVKFTNPVGDVLYPDFNVIIRCVKDDGALNGFCKWELSNSCAKVANPIDVAYGYKSEDVTDWTSPLEQRFSFTREYHSNPYQLDDSGAPTEHRIQPPPFGR